MLYDIDVIKNNLKRTTEKLMVVANKIGLIINENKTNLMIVSRRDYPQNTISVNYYNRNVFLNSQ